jgi:hypothetical protein
MKKFTSSNVEALPLDESEDIEPTQAAELFILVMPDNQNHGDPDRA